jgi:uncharacterized protein (TIGR02001 family)
MKKSILAFAALAVFAGAASAQLTANVAVTSKYKYRGQDQSDPEEYVLPAIQGGFDYTLGGLYIGNWNSSIGFGGGTEMDFYAGYKGDIGSGFGYDVGLLQYYYPGNGTSALNTTEVYGAVSYAFASLKYSYTASSKYFGIVDGQGTGYLDLSANYEIVKGLTLNGHIGQTFLSSDGKDSSGLVNYLDYKLGATYDLGSGFALAGAYIGANKKDVWGDINKGRVIVTISKVM